MFKGKVLFVLIGHCLFILGIVGSYWVLLDLIGYCWILLVIVGSYSLPGLVYGQHVIEVYALLGISPNLLCFCCSDARSRRSYHRARCGIFFFVSHGGGAIRIKRFC